MRTNTQQPRAAVIAAFHNQLIERRSMNEKCISADGVELSIGTTVAHFMDDWDGAREALLITQHPSGVWLVTYWSRYNEMSSQPSHTLYATREGLLAERIRRLDLSILYHENEVAVDKELIAKLTAELAAGATR